MPKSPSPLTSFLRLLVTSSILIVSTLLHCSLLFLLAFVKFAVPVAAVRTRLTRALIVVAESWIAVNSFTMAALTPLDFRVEGDANLAYKGHYLVISNHQSWVDIPVLQRAFNKRIPFLKFFLKKELIWVPVLGLAWWALDFPFMKRHSRELLARRPELRGSDLATTRKACEKFRLVPVSVMNFLEGSRFTEGRRDAQESPHAHLLRAKAGGIAFVLGAMGDVLDTMLDVTLVYPQGRPTFTDLLGGRVPRVDVLIRERSIPADLRGGDYENDAEFRERFQAWVRQLWQDKDALLEERLGVSRS